MIEQSSPLAATGPRGARVCLVTSEFHGLFKNGGIGTANTGLALGLVEAGFQVTVAFVDPTAGDDPDKQSEFDDVRDGYRARGLTLEAVPRHPLLRAGHEDHLAASYSVYAYLEMQPFDIVFFNECSGQGYYSLLAKRAGQFSNAPSMYVVTHGSNEWVLELNAQLYWGLHPIAVSYLERRSVELADVLVSPSRYLVDWMASRGWELPPRTHVIQNLLPPDAEPAPPVETSSEIRELVFFGRLEARKGLDMFCEAITAMQKSHDFSSVAVTFLGKFARIGGLHSGVYVIETSRKWQVSPRLIAHYDSARALEYLRRPGVLAVIPSLAENSPCVVAECLIAGIPFLTTDSGGTAELIAPEHRERCLAAPNADALRVKLGEALRNGVSPARMAIPRSESRARWLELLLSPPSPSSGTLARAAKVSICVVRDSASEPHAKGLESILAQSYRDFELVVVEYGAASDDGPMPGPRDSRMRRFHRRALDRADARNATATLAGGDWLLFVEEREILLKPNCLDAYVEAATRLGADIITGPALEHGQAGPPIEGWDGQLGALLVGAHIELAAFENCLGQSVMLFARRTFEAVGGFERGVPEPIEDRLLLTKAILADAKLGICPKPLFWRRVARARVAEVHERGGEQRRILRAYAGREVRVIEHALESVLASGPRNRERILAALAGLGNAAKDIATRLSLAPQQGGPDPAKPFVEYCVARGRFREAYEFAVLAESSSLMAFARGAANAAAEKAAFGAIRVTDRDEWHEIPLNRQVAERVRSVRNLRDDALTRGGEVVVAHAMSLGTTVLKAPAVCPPRAALVNAVVAMEGDPRASTRVALAVCEPFATLSLDDGESLAREGAWWSGWITPAADGAETVVAARIEPPVDRPLDVFLISRLDGFFTRRARVVWKSVGAEVHVLAHATASAIELDDSSSSLPRHVIARAELLTPARDFPAPYFVPGDPNTHHPLQGRPALVRIPKAIFPGATGVRAMFSVENENAHPIEFAFWARRSTDPVKDPAALDNSEGFSGWTAVRSPFQQHQATLTLAAPARQLLDLYLATRVVEFDDVNYCHAVWHDFFVLESLTAPTAIPRRA